VGSVDNIIDGAICDSEGDVTSNYDITYVIGTLTVNKRPITIVSGDGEWVYDGQSHINDEYSLAEDSEYQLVSGHVSKISVTTEIINVSEIYNALVINIFDGEKDVTDFYDITYDYGKLTVTQRPITVEVVDSEYIYDGTAHETKEINVVSGTLVAGHYYSFSTYGSQTVVGSCDTNIIEGSVSIRNGSGTDNDMTGNYAITIGETGTITVKARPVTFTTATSSWNYDGEEHSDGTHVLSAASEYGLVEGQNSVSSELATITEITSINNSMTIGIYDGDEDVTVNYSISYELGKLTINPRPVTITTQSYSFVYDGKAHSYEYFDVAEKTDDSGLLSGHNAQLSGYASIVNKGQTTNDATVSIISGNKDVTAYYDIDLQKGTLTVTARPIAIQTASDTFLYDAAEHSNIGYEISAGSLAEGQGIKISDDTVTKIIQVGSCANKFEIYIVDGDNANVTDNYSITYSYGTLTVNKLPVQITSGSVTAVYDATPVSCQNYNYEVSNESKQLPYGHKIVITDYASLTDVGTIDNEISVIICQEDDSDVSSNYDISYVNGKITVTPCPLTITADSDQKVYDGLPLIVSTFTFVYKDTTYLGTEKIPTEHSIVIENNTSLTAVNTIDNVISSAKIKDSNNVDVTSNYSITLNNGKLTVSKRPITIQAQYAEKIYDATALTSDAIILIDDTTLAAASIVNNYSIVASTTGSQTDAGSSDNPITRNSVTIWDNNGNEVTGYYDITYSDSGELYVIPRPITLLSGSDSKYYDGEPLICHNWEYYENSLHIVDGQTLVDIKYEGTQTDADQSANIMWGAQISAEINGVTKDVTYNYNISYEYGTLTVLPRPISITTASHEWQYDGENHCDIGYEVTSDLSFIDAQYSEVDANSVTYIKHDKELANMFTVKAYDKNTGVDKSRNYAITYTYGKLTLTNRTVGLVTNDHTWEYDGQKHYDIGYTVIPGAYDGLVSTDEVKELSYRTITDVTKCENVVVYQIVDNDNYDVTSFYDMSISYGQLEITPKPITLTINGDYEKTYDGLAYREICDMVVSSGSLLDGQYAIAILSCDFVRAGTYYTTADATNITNIKIIDDQNYDYTSNYTITIASTDITVVINQRHITIEAADYTREYDGTEVCTYDLNITVNISSDTSFADASITDQYTMAAKTNSTLKNVGWCYNPIDLDSVRIRDNHGEDVTDCYSITCKDESIYTVTPRQITILSGDAKKAYDGSPLTCNTFTVTNGNVVEWHYCQVEMSGSITDFGTAPNTISKVTIIDTLTNEDVTSNYEITTEYGTLMIQNGAVIHPYGISYVYDGKPHSYSDDDWYWEDQPDGFVVEINLSSISLTNVGTITNEQLQGLTVKIYNAEGQDISEMYVVSFEYAAFADSYLSVTKRNITVNTKSATKVYDGKELTCNEYWLTGALADGDSMVVTFNDGIVDVGTAENTYNDVRIYNKDGQDVTDNYNISSSFGTLEVES
jgi:hypothetical protein